MSSGDAPPGSLSKEFDHLYLPKIIGRLINNAQNNFVSSLKQKKNHPKIDISINGQVIEALLDTGATKTNMNLKTFRRLFPQGGRPTKVHNTGVTTGANGIALKKIGTFQIPFSLGGKNYDFPVNVFSDLNTDFVIGIDFMHSTGLSYDAGRKELFRSDTKSYWKTANMELSENVTLKAISKQIVTVNAVIRDQARPGRACTAVATVNSNEHVITGGPALVNINRMGQAQMEIFNCNAWPITIKRDSIIGMIEQLQPEEEIALLNVEEMSATLENKVPVITTKLTQEKEKFIREMANLNVPKQFQQKYIDLLVKHHQVISSDKNDLGHCKTFYHDIQLRDEQPIFVQQFKIQDVNRKAVEDHVKDMLKLGCIKPSKSKFNSPIFIVKKKDGGIRIVQDFRALNKQTMVDKYSMRDVQECIDEIGRAGSKIFSTLDLTSGFWQMLLNPDSQKYTAFTIPGLGQFEWNSSPMGLLGAPGSFQRLMEIVIHNLKNVIAYIDDLLVHTRTHEEQLDSLDQLFVRLNKNGLKINLKKSFFGCEEVGYLGFRLTPNGVLPGTDKLKAVREALPPSNVHEVRQFMGLCNFFRGHVRNFAQISAPLNALTRKEDTWKQGPLPEEAQHAFRKLQMILTSEPIIHYPQPELTYALVTNAGPKGFGATLAQVLPNGKFQTISYASRKLKDHEIHYAPFLLDITASDWAMDHYSVYLKGKHFLLFADNKPIEPLSAIHTKTLNRKQETMKQFNFEIFSQNDPQLPTDLRSENLICEISFDNEKWRKIQNEEPWIIQCKEWLLNGTKPSHPLSEQFTRKLFAKFLFIENDLLWRRYDNKVHTEAGTCLVIPESMGERVLKEGQGEIFAKNDSAANIKDKMLQHFWWPEMDGSIEKFVKTRTQTPSNEKKGVPNSKISVDMFTMPVKSDMKNSSILCITDNVTKYAELIAIKNDEAKTIAEAIFLTWMMRHGIPTEISFNEDQEFCNQISEKFSTLLDVSATFNPLCSSRNNEVVNTEIRKLLIELKQANTLDWENYIPALMFCYNTSFQRKINTSPHFLTYGQNARQPAFQQGDLQKRYYGETSAGEKFNILQLARQISREMFTDQEEFNEQIFNRQSASHTFQKCDWVYFKGKGPYQIVQLKPHNNVILQIKNSKVCVNIEHLNYDNVISPNISFQKQEGGESVFPPKRESEGEKEIYKAKLRSHSNKQSLQALIEAEAEKRWEEEKERNLISAIWHRDNPIKLKLRKIIQATPQELIKKRFPNWSEAQIINFHYSGDINIGPDDPELISIGEAGSLPSQFYNTFFPPIQVPQPQPAQPLQPVHQIDPALIGPNPFGQLRQRNDQPQDQWKPAKETRGQATPGPPEPDGQLPQGSGTGRTGSPTPTGPLYDLERIRPELRTANFDEASNLTRLNADEQAYFRQAFQLPIRLREVQQEEEKSRKGFGFNFFK